MIAESGVLYVAPSNVLLPVLSTPATTVERSRSFSADESSLAVSFLI
jgi:hypothetical protein